MTEVHELLSANAAISVYKYGPLDEIEYEYSRVRRNEEHRISQLVTDAPRDSCGSGGMVVKLAFVRPGIESTSTGGMGCTVSTTIMWAQKWTDE